MKVLDLAVLMHNTIFKYKNEFSPDGEEFKSWNEVEQWMRDDTITSIVRLLRMDNPEYHVL